MLQDKEERISGVDILSFRILKVSKAGNMMQGFREAGKSLPKFVKNGS